MSARDSFLVYQVIRPLFLFGLRIKPMLDALASQPGDRMLDVGCGFGYLVNAFADCDYTGIDADAGRIERAREIYGETATRRFLVADATRTGHDDKSLDRAIGYGLLHHLSDEVASECIRELMRVTRTRIVFADPVYAKVHLINNVLCRLDRGKHVRTEGGYRSLCGLAGAKVDARTFYARSGIAKYFVTILDLPRPGSAD
jgi:SAM-dependent methyltransferase